MSSQPPVQAKSPVQTTDNRVTDPRVTVNVYHQTSDIQRQKAVDALSRKPYFSTRPPEEFSQERVARERG
jgi:hypothetical protein